MRFTQLNWLKTGWKPTSSI